MAHISSDHHAGRTWGIKVQTLIVKSTGARFSYSLISAVTSKGHMRFMVTEGGVSSSVFIEFLKRLLIGTKDKIYLIEDNGPSHVSKKHVSSFSPYRRSSSYFICRPIL